MFSSQYWNVFLFPLSFEYGDIAYNCPHLNPKSFLKRRHSVGVYSSQKEIEYISASNSASFTIYFISPPPSHSWYLAGFLPWASGDSAIHVFLVSEIIRHNKAVESHGRLGRAGEKHPLRVVFLRKVILQLRSFCCFWEKQETVYSLVVM